MGALETIATAVGTGLALGGVVVAWLNATIDGKLTKNNLEMLALINGKYISKEVFELKLNAMRDAMDRARWKAQGGNTE